MPRKTSKKASTETVPPMGAAISDSGIDIQSLATSLMDRGWLPQVKTLGALGSALLSAWQAYLKWSELPPESAAIELLKPRFCGHPDRMALRAGEIRRNKNDITFAAFNSLPGFSDTAFMDAVQHAFDYWRQAGLKVSARPALAGESFDIIVQASRIDGRGNVLAQCELPPGHNCWVDNVEQWFKQEGTLAGTQYAELWRVLCHEFGHFWGCDHIPPGQAVALMNPTVSQTIDRPTKADVDLMVSMGFERVSTTPIPPPPSPPSPVTPLITIDPINKVIRASGYRLIP